MKNIFEIATRKRIRFNYMGSLSVEDLWNLSVDKLDSIFKDLNSQMKQASEESLLNEKTAEDEILAIKIDIIKHIVNTKLAESNERAEILAKKAERQKLMAILDEKKDEELRNKTADEITQMIDKL